MTGKPIYLNGQRRVGIFCPITSLPGNYGCGDVGQVSRDYVQWLASIGGTIWQILPLNSTGEGVGYSPYSPDSAMAMSIQYLDIDGLCDTGLLGTQFDLPNYLLGLGMTFNNVHSHCDFNQAQKARRRLISLAYHNMVQEEFEPCMKEAFESWKQANEDWVLSHALYQVIKSSLEENRCWSDWHHRGLKSRDQNAISEVSSSHSVDIDIECFVQFLLFTQMHSLREFARSKGVCIMGDIPIYISLDSADMWEFKHQFEIDTNSFEPIYVSGVPPDYFSATGQRWGTPLPKWEEHHKDDFRWWRRRIRMTFSCVDAIRLDHFRGIASYWKIEATEETAINGVWCKGPDRDFIDAMLSIVDSRQLVVEDLGGESHADVMALRDSYELRGMAVLQFGFSEGAQLHLPHNHRKNLVVYPGTHDNDTIMGWLSSSSKSEKDKFERYTNLPDGTSPSEMAIRLAMGSVAETAIISISDYLGLGSEARINVPSTSQGNWTWKLNQPPATFGSRDIPNPEKTSRNSVDARGARFKELAQLFDRTPSHSRLGRECMFNHNDWPHLNNGIK